MHNAVKRVAGDFLAEPAAGLLHNQILMPVFPCHPA
jgi:hypothetical protein